MSYTAYLIVVCDNITNAVVIATIWSAPEWEQSQCLRQRTYVAYATTGRSYAEARENIVKAIQQPESRYHWLLEYLNKSANFGASNSLSSEGEKCGIDNQSS